MFREMRRKEKQLLMEETMEVLNKGEYGVLSTVGADNYPYGVPVNYVYHNESIYFHCATVGHKIDNIENNSNVSFCVVCDTEVLPAQFNTKFRSVILFGKAKEVVDKEKEEALLTLLHKFSSKHIEAGKKYMEKAWDQTKVIKIEIEHIDGKGKK